jgi:hypothetical protein
LAGDEAQSFGSLQQSRIEERPRAASSTCSALQTKKIKVLHENDFTLAAKVDPLIDGSKTS